MKNIFFYLALLLFFAACSEDTDLEKMMEDPAKEDGSQEQTDMESDLKASLPYEPGDEIFYKINIYEILSEKIDDERKDSIIKKILPLAKKAEEEGRNAYSKFIREFGKNKKKLRKLNYYFKWDDDINEGIVETQTWKSIYEEIEDVGRIMKDRLHKLGYKDVRFFLEDAGMIRIILPEGAPTSQIEDYLLKPGQFQFAVVKNDNSIPEILYEIDEALAPDKKPKVSSEDVEIVFVTDHIFTNHFVTYYLPPDRKAQPQKEEYSDSDFPKGYYYFSIYDKMVDDFRELLNKTEVIEKIPEDLKLLFTSTPKAYFSDQAQDTFKIYDFYFIERDNAISGDIIEDVYFSYSPDNNPALFITLNKTGSEDLEKITAENTGRNMAIVLDNKIYDAPIIQSKIKSGKVTIQNIRSEREGKFLELILKSGSYDLPVYRYEPEED